MGAAGENLSVSYWGKRRAAGVQVVGWWEPISLRPLRV